MTLNPIMSDQISYEKPVGAAPTVFESVIGAVANLGADYAEATSGKRDVKNEVLSAFSRDMEEIASANIPQSEKDQRARRLRRDYMSQYADFQPEFSEISSDEFGFEEEQFDAGRLMADQVQTWVTETPEGQAALASNASIGAEGLTVTPEGWSRVQQMHLQNLQRQARIAGFETGQKEEAIVWDELQDDWTGMVMEHANDLMTQASKNPQFLEQPEMVLQSLEERKAALRNTIIQEGQAAGISQTMIQERIDDLMAPLQNIENMYTNQMENIPKFAATLKATNDIGRLRLFTEKFGVLGTSPDFQRVFFDQYLVNIVGSKLASDWLEGLDDMAQSYQGFDFAVDGLPGTPGAVTNPSTLSRPEKVTEFREKQKENENFLPTRVLTASGMLKQNIGTPEGRQVVFHALEELAVIGEAYEGPIGQDTLRRVFSPEAISNITALGEEGKSMVAGILSQQVRQYRAMVLGNTSLMQDRRIQIRDGKFVAQKRIRFAPDAWEWKDETSGDAFDYAQSVNFIRAVAKQIPGVDKVVENATQYLSRGVEPDEDMVSREDISWPDLENVQHTSGTRSPNALVTLIDRTEARGEYDTLFGYSNKGGPFAGTAVNEMTIGQALQFASPDGAYGQWVKEQVGRVATPMGRYQIVGTTLREAAEQMGLPLNTVFNRQTQDAIFHFLAERRVRGKSGAAAREALRKEWEGFKNVSDDELDRAIAAFKGTPAPSLQGLQTATGSGGGPGFGTPPEIEARQTNPFMAALAGGGDVDTPRGRQFNPSVSVTGSGQIQEESRASRRSTEDARRQVIATLNEMGYSDAEINQVLSGEKEAQA